MEHFSEKQAYQKWLIIWGVEQGVKLFLLSQLVVLFGQCLVRIQKAVPLTTTGSIHWQNTERAFTGKDLLAGLSLLLSFVLLFCIIDCLIGFCQGRQIRLFRFFFLFLLIADLCVVVGVDLLTGSTANGGGLGIEGTFFGVYGAMIAFYLFKRYRTLEESKLAEKLWELYQETKQEKTAKAYFGIRSVEVTEKTIGWKEGQRNRMLTTKIVFSVGQHEWLSFTANVVRKPLKGGEHTCSA